MVGQNLNDDKKFPSLLERESSNREHRVLYGTDLYSKQAEVQ